MAVLRSYVSACLDFDDLLLEVPPALSARHPFSCPSSCCSHTQLSPAPSIHTSLMVSTAGPYVNTSNSNWARTLVQALALPLLSSFMVWFRPTPLALSRRMLFVRQVIPGTAWCFLTSGAENSPWFPSKTQHLLRVPWECSFQGSSTLDFQRHLQIFR